MGPARKTALGGAQQAALTADPAADAAETANLPIGEPAGAGTLRPTFGSRTAGQGGLSALPGSVRSGGEPVSVGPVRHTVRRVGPELAHIRPRNPAPGFANRAERRIDAGSDVDRYAGRTEQAVELGLDFLARQQLPEGNWSLQPAGGISPGHEGETATFRSDTAATGLALLAFLGAGYDHYDDQFRHVVRRGLQYLVRSQRADGDLYVPMNPESDANARLYSHGIAAIALCEAFGMTGDAELRPAAQRAMDFIAAAQDTRFGGWRYTPGTGSDTSVSGWQLMALKSGELAGLKINPAVYAHSRRWLDYAQAAESGGAEYVYSPHASGSPQQRRATPAMTAVGLLMRLYLGWNRNHPQMVRGAEVLLRNLPQDGSPSAPLRDTYYWYYATQVMFHMKGNYWRQWNDRLHGMLVDGQLQDGDLRGSWDPLGKVPDRWGQHGGRLYVTTLNLLSLEVYYRHLPLYESTAR